MFGIFGWSASLQFWKSPDIAYCNSHPWKVALKKIPIFKRKIIFKCWVFNITCQFSGESHMSMNSQMLLVVRESWDWLSFRWFGWCRASNPGWVFGERERERKTDFVYCIGVFWCIFWIIFLKHTNTITFFGIFQMIHMIHLHHISKQAIKLNTEQTNSSPSIYWQISLAAHAGYHDFSMAWCWTAGSWSTRCGLRMTSNIHTFLPAAIK